MLERKPPQTSFYGAYLYERIVPADHLLRKIDQTVDFSFVRDLVRDRYREDFGRPAEDPEFMLRLCLLQYLYGDSDRQVVANARVNLAYKYFLGLAVDEEVPDDTTVCHFRAVPAAIRLPDFPGGLKFAHLHYNNRVYPLTDTQWQKYAGGVVTDGRTKLANATHIGFEAGLALGEALEMM